MNKKQIMEKVFSLFPKEIIKTIIRYGNPKGNDIDLFIVLKGIFVEYGVLRKFPLDIVYMQDSFFKKSLKNLDPMATDPILTGKTIYGENIKDLKRRLKKSKPTKNTTRCLLGRAKTFLEWTKHYHRHNNFKEVLTGVHFASTYIYLAIHYQKNPKIITFTELLKVYGKTLVGKSLLALKKGLFNEIIPLITETEKLLTITSDMLL